LDVNYLELLEECGDVYDMYGLKDLMMLKRSESASKGIAASPATALLHAANAALRAATAVLPTAASGAAIVGAAAADENGNGAAAALPGVLEF
jgi:hypothetical protein